MTKKERFVLWLNKLGRGCNRITIVVLYITIMIILGTLIYGANQQKATSNVTVTYSRPSYTVSFDPAGGEGVSPSYKTVKLGDNYGDLPTPTREGYSFAGWQKSDGTTVTSTTQNTTIGDHILTAKWMENVSYLTRDWTSRIGDNTSLNSVTTSIIFTKDSSKISGFSNSVSVGTNSQTSTDAYTATTGVEDVRAYWGSDKSTIVIYSPATIYAPQDSSNLFCIDLEQNIFFEKLTTLDLTNFNTSKVRNMSSMFFYCNSLTSLTFGSNFNTSSVTEMFGMFGGCLSIISLDLGNFDTSQVTSMSHMFMYCIALEDLNLSNFNTSEVTDIGGMFAACSSLASLDVSNFNTSKVTNMSSMFSSCSSLTSLTFGSNFNTSNVTDMSNMFSSCTSLTSLDVSNFDTSKVTDMSEMFYECTSLTSLNLGNFNLASCTSFNTMLSSCSAESITLPYNLQSGMTINLPASTYYNGSAGPYSTIGTATSGTTVACSTESSKIILALKTVSYLTRNWTSRIGDNTSLNTVTTSIIFTDDLSKTSGLSNSVSVGTLSPTSTNSYENYEEIVGVEDVRAYWGSDKSTIVIYSPVIIFAPKDCSYLFTVGLSNSSTRVFSKLANLDLTNFDTSNVTNMSMMFENCSSLTSLDVSNFDTSNVTNMRSMFEYCSSLTSLDLSNFDTSNVTNMSYMFRNCSSLTSLDVSNLDTSKATEMFSMFKNCTSLTSLDLGNFNLVSCTYFSNMLAGCDVLASITLPYNLQSGKTIGLPASTYYNGSEGPYDTIGTATSGTTVECSTESSKIILVLKTVSYLTRDWISRIGDNTSLNSVTTSIIFTKDSSKISGFSNSVSVGTNSQTSTDAYTATTGVEDVRAYWGSDKSTIVVYSPGTIYAPQDCSWLFVIDYDQGMVFEKLTTLDLTNFDTSKVTNMYGMFFYCISLTSLTFGSNFNTSSVTDMSYMFAACPSLTSLDVSNFNTSNVTKMIGMFSSCTSLTSLDVSNFDTSNVADMSYMFSSCSSLASLDVSNFDTSNVADMSSMFYDCSSLTSLTFGSNFNTSNVTNMSNMFDSCSSLTSLDVSNFDTSKVTDMSYMFQSCSKVTSLDVSNFNTSNVTNMYNMFYNCSSLTSLNLGNFNLASCTNFSNMLTNCSALASITLPYNLQSGYTISLPASTYYNGSAGPYSTVGTATSGTTVACSTASSKVTLTKQ